MTIEQQASVYERLQLILESEYKMSEKELADRDAQIKGRYIYLLINEEQIIQDNIEERLRTKVMDMEGVQNEIKASQDKMKSDFDKFINEWTSTYQDIKVIKEKLESYQDPNVRVQKYLVKESSLHPNLDILQFKKENSKRRVEINPDDL